jgi:hypothetical protein
MDSLPPELVELIAQHLSLDDYVSFALVSKSNLALLEPHTVKRYISQLGELTLFYLIRADALILKRALDAYLEAPREIDWYQLSKIKDQTIKVKIMKSARKFQSHLPVDWNVMFKHAWQTNELEVVKFITGEVDVTEFLVGNWYFRLISHNHIEMMSYLLQLGAHVGSKLPVIQILLQNRHYDAIKCLLDKNDPELDLESVWTLASLDGHTKIIQMLLDKGLSPRTGDWITVRWSIQKSFNEILQLLFDYGMSAEEIEPEMPMFFSIRSGSVKVVECLLRNGVKPTCLREAIQLGSLEMVRLLVEHGADIADSHYDAIRIAKEMRLLQIHDYLVQKCTQKHDKAQTKTLFRKFINDSADLQILPGYSNRTWL